MADRIETHLIVKAIAKGFDTVAKEQKKITKESKKQKSVLKTLKENWVKVGAAAMGVMVALKGLKKVWDFAEQGAQVRQQAESFDFLMKKIGVTTDVLSGLQKASRGTVDDMTLMSGTATLLAGAGDELAKKLAEATPQLMEIAKASNKLNPSLGTTAFMYESIATGIKRAQPLILDNLGLTIKVGAANKAYADKLGIVVTALTAEQKAMAMLEAALEAGDNLIGQVGGTTESATDSFARFTAVLKNMADAAKADLGESLGPIVGKLADLMIHGQRVSEVMSATGVTLDDFAGYVNAAGVTIAENDAELLAWYESLGNVGARVHDLSGYFSNFPEVDDGVEGSVEDLGDAALDTADDFVHLWDVATPDPGAMIQGLSEYIAYMDSNIPEIVTGMEEVSRALAEGLITEEQAQEAMGQYSVALANEKIAMGATAREAATDISKELGIGYEEAYAMLDENVLTPLATLDGSTVSFTIIENVRRNITEIVHTGGGGPERKQHGGQLGKGWTLVGDPGPNEELISPWGWVFDAQTTKKMLQGGMVPSTKRYISGDVEGTPVTSPSPVVHPGGGGGITYDPETYPDDYRGIKPSEREAYFAAQGASVVVVEQTAAVAAPAAATEAAAAVASTVSAAASVQSQAIHSAIAKQISESKKLKNEMVAVREAIEALPDPIGDRVTHGMETLDTR